MPTTRSCMAGKSLPWNARFKLSWNASDAVSAVFVIVSRTCCQHSASLTADAATLGYLAACRASVFQSPLRSGGRRWDFSLKVWTSHDEQALRIETELGRARGEGRGVEGRVGGGVVTTSQEVEPVWQGDLVKAEGDSGGGVWARLSARRVKSGIMRF